MVTCARCGHENPDGAKFCLECGNALAPAVAPREERKVVSVLFADLIGFTAQAERMDPEEVRAVLAPYHAMLRAEIQRYNGTVEKFIGDAVMALFGAPLAHEDDPERAVRAALAIRDAIVDDGKLHVRVGVTTGEALVALDARPDAGEGMAAGDVVNSAARLQTVAPADGILVDEATYRATSRGIDYRDHEPVTVKGKAAPIAVHEAVAARSRFGVDVRQMGLVPLVGRTRELDLLSDALARSISERQPQLVTLVGVPGIGKSRLVWELFGEIDRGTQLVRWRQGRSLPYADSISFWALGEIVKAETGVLETDTPEAAQEKLAAAVAALPDLAADAEWIERHLRPLVGLESGVESRTDRRGESFAAWRRYIEALADDRPLVLVFEDLHWADDGLLDFIDNLLDWVTDVPVLVVGTARPELLSRRPGWGGGKTNALTVSLSPLSEVETNSLVGALVEQALIPVSVRQAVLDRAQGNPLYAEEFARLIAAGGAIDELPDTVQGIVAARLDGLSRAQKDLLQDAAVLGKVFWIGAVAAMGGRPRQELEDELHALERREFVRRERRASVAGETEYAFRHIVMRDVAYGQIPRAQRAQRHVKAAAWIESLGRSSDHAELLAQHYLAALDLDRAAGKDPTAYADVARSAIADAGEHAMALNSFAQAARYLSAALDLSPPDDAARPLLLLAYGKALRVGEEAGADVLAEAERALLAAGDVERAGEAIVLQAELAWFGGDGELTSHHLRRADAIVGRMAPSYSKAFVLSDLSRYHMLRGEFADAITVGERALDMAERLRLDEVRAHALNNIGSALGGLGRSSESIASLEQALEIARRINSPEQARIINNLAVQLDEIGDTHRSRPLVREGVRLARELGNRPVEKFMGAWIPDIEYHEGNWDQALKEAEAALASIEGGRASVIEPPTRTIRGRIRLARGDIDGALEDADRALAAGRRMGEAQFVVAELGQRAWVLLQVGRPDEARSMLADLVRTGNNDKTSIEAALALRELGGREALVEYVSEMKPGRYTDLFEAIAQDRLTDAVALADEIEIRPSACLIRLTAAQQLAERGDNDAAREIVGPAIDFWRSVGATYWLERADRLLAGVPRVEA